MFKAKKLPDDAPEIAKKLDAEGEKKDNEIIEKNPQKYVMKRFNFYRDGYRSAASVIFVLTGFLSLSMATNVYQWTQRQDVIREYFATDTAGVVTKLYPLSQPYINESQVKNWLVKAIGDIYSMSVRDYDKVLSERMPQYVIPETAQLLRARILQSSRLNELITESGIVSVHVAGLIETVRAGVVSGRYQWTFKLPIQLDYQSTKGIRSELRVLTVNIIRVDTRTFPAGVAIKTLLESEPVNTNSIR